ncbi:MAG: hypothetical protein C0601_00545 [Candidatus Muiribacterium halophilum]|uniref:Uncharacterized protein n=1 Tax=Muiribacterium halophilum TaxID=2053465 RepID=A0A2N5ZMN5_MUIH1|nr:MAG: hypothetical protein C0601_00545 [Candidatus Muirbacterium halophilum]
MFRAINKKEKRVMVTNNGVKQIRNRRKLSYLMFSFVIIISLVMFFSYSRFAMAADDFDFGEFGDDFGFDDSGSGSSDAGAFDGAGGDAAAGNASGEDNEFDMTPGELAKYEIVSKERLVKYFDDDQSNDKSLKDPFKVLIEKKILKPKAYNPGAGEVAPEDVVIPKLDIKLVGVIQAGDRTLAMVTVEDKYMELFEGDGDPEGNFKVKQINEDSMVIISFRRNGELRTIQLDGGN